MVNFQILANDLFFLILIRSNYICFFWYYIHIKTRVNRNFTTSTFFFCGIKMNLEITQFDIIQSQQLYQFKIKDSMIIIHVITILNDKILF
jgi:hypothetical protein